MKLKYSTDIRNKKIYITAETIDFTPEEDKLLDDLGEPVIAFNKTYEIAYAVEFTRKIKSGFKINVNFDGTTDLTKASSAALTFIEDLKTELSNVMTLLKSEADKIAITEKSEEIIEILY